MRRILEPASMNFKFYKGSKSIVTDVNEMKGIMRGIGLIFRTRNTNNLLFAFTQPSRISITGLFVFFPFLAVWLNNRKKVIEYRMVYPFEISIKPRKKASYLIEIPLNSANLKIYNQNFFRN